MLYIYMLCIYLVYKVIVKNAQDVQEYSVIDINHLERNDITK